MQKRYNSIPRPVYPITKRYIQDFLTRHWILKSESEYSSSIVVTRKNDGNLRLRVDCRGPNNLIVVNRRPLPRAYEAFDGHIGDTWFSVLDIAKHTTRHFITRKVEISQGVLHLGAK